MRLSACEMDHDALLARAAPCRCICPPANKTTTEFRSVARTQRGAAHLRRLRERQRDFSLVMRQLLESTEMTIPAAAPLQQHPVTALGALQARAASSGTASAQAAPAAASASPRPAVIPRGASPRQMRRIAAACEARRTRGFANPEYVEVRAGMRVCVDGTTLRTVGSIPAGLGDRPTGGMEERVRPEDQLTASLSHRSQSVVAAFEQASRTADVALYRVMGKHAQ